MKFLKIIKNFIYSVEYTPTTYRTHEIHKIVRILGIKFKFKTFNVQNVDCLRNKKLENCVAIISPDGIGDYMSIRQFFKYIKESPKYKGQPVVMFEQPNHYNFAKVYDSEYFDDIILYTDDLINFRGDLKRKLNNYNFSTVICLQSRKIAKSLVKVIKAEEKIVEYPNIDNLTEIDIKKSFPEFNNIIMTECVGFEWERKRIFFERALGILIEPEKLNIAPILDFREKYITISLMAMNVYRCYSNKKWVDVLEYIIQNTKDNIKLLFIGGKIDFDLTSEIIGKLSNKNRCINLCGLIDSSMIPVVLKNAEFLLSPETGTVHIAAALNCPTICLSCGANYGRCLPHDNVTYIYPDEFDEILVKNSEEIKDFYYFNYKYKTESISPYKINKYLCELLNKLGLYR